MRFAMRSYGCSLQAVDLLRAAGYLDASREGSEEYVVSVSVHEDLDELHVHQLVQAIDSEARPLV